MAFRTDQQEEPHVVGSRRGVVGRVLPRRWLDALARGLGAPGRAAARRERGAAPDARGLALGLRHGGDARDDGGPPSAVRGSLLDGRTLRGVRAAVGLLLSLAAETVGDCVHGDDATHARREQVCHLLPGRLDRGIAFTRGARGRRPLRAAKGERCASLAGARRACGALRYGGRAPLVGDDALPRGGAAVRGARGGRGGGPPAPQPAALLRQPGPRGGVLRPHARLRLGGSGL
mmetsp:Transcript_22057/g.68814  ORF Transcript_22057/g.68814 Transcript_22057/m.68814 type:complete len:233 (+) Transcript_22057:273-971(+)